MSSTGNVGIRVVVALVGMLVLLTGCSSTSDLSRSGTTVDVESGDDNAVGRVVADDDESPDPELGDGLSASAAGRDSVLAFADVPMAGDLAVVVDRDAPEPTSAEVIYLHRADDETVRSDGVVEIEYVMAEWGGQVVEWSGQLADQLMVSVGRPSDVPPDVRSVPRALEEALVGSTVGSRFMISFPAGMSDLPPNLDPTVAHVVVVDIVSFQKPTGQR